MKKWVLGVMMVGSCLAGVAWAGDLYPSAEPGDAGSAMYTGQNILNRLQTGTNAPLRAGAFTEPTAGPTAGTMPTLNEIMAAAPATNAAAALPGEVLADKVYWGLVEGAWGTQTGTMATRTLSAANDTVQAGYYAATTLTAVDADLAATNIRYSTVVFGQTGTLRPALGNATAAQVLTGRTFTTNNSAELTGTMANQAARGFMPSNVNRAISAGYYDGSGVVTGDADLVTANIRAGVNLFGVAGTPAVVNTASGTAVAGDMLSGEIAYVNGAAITGTLATRTLSAANATVAAGYYAATTLTAVDADLAAGNIATNVTIFGVAGTVSTNANAYAAAVPKTGQTTSYATDDDGALEKGVALPNPRFTVQANTNCVLDNLTGLVWARNANLFGGVTWGTAVTNCNNLTYGGQSDWRLPNARELKSLVHYAYYNPALCNTAGTGQWTANNPFTGVQSGYYWSSSSYPFGETKWMIQTYGGEDLLGNLAIETPYVWPVRGGP